MSGFFEIGIDHCKFPENLGTLWRSAYQLGASGIFTIKRKSALLVTDTTHSWRHIPLRCYVDVEELVRVLPRGMVLVGIEMAGVELQQFKHPRVACYVLGSEDNGLTNAMRDKCQEIVSIPAVRQVSYNVAVAGSIVMYHRMIQRRTTGELI